MTDATTMMTILKTAGRVTEAEVKTVIDFITKPPAKPAPLPSSSPEWKLSYEQRAAMCSNPMSARILKTMVEKRSNLCVAVDVTKMADLIKITEAVAPYAFAVKTHADMIEVSHHIFTIALLALQVVYCSFKKILQFDNASRWADETREN